MFSNGKKALSSKKSLHNQSKAFHPNRTAIHQLIKQMFVDKFITARNHSNDNQFVFTSVQWKVLTSNIKCQCDLFFLIEFSLRIVLTRNKRSINNNIFFSLFFYFSLKTLSNLPVNKCNQSSSLISKRSINLCNCNLITRFSLSLSLVKLSVNCYSNLTQILFASLNVH